MKCKSANSAKILFGCFNTLFFACGIAEVVCGFLLLCDTQRVLLSRLLVDPDGPLAQPPFYYLALALLASGLAICAVAVLGCWATYMPGYVVLTIYFLAVLSLVAATSAGGAAAATWPRCVANSRLGGNGPRASLAAHYGVPDYEQYTAAVDLAQTQLQCCGMTEGRNYDMSVWQLRRLGPRGLAVPLSCCVLRRPASYLNPEPLNQTRCQQLTPDPQYRHVPGCSGKLEEWYQQQYLIFMLSVFVIGLLKIGVLLSTVFSCIRLRKRKLNMQSYIMKSIDNTTNENIYEYKLNRVQDEPIKTKYVQPNNFYSPRIRNPRIFHNKPHDIV